MNKYRSMNVFLVSMLGVLFFVPTNSFATPPNVDELKRQEQKTVMDISKMEATLSKIEDDKQKAVIASRIAAENYARTQHNLQEATLRYEKMKSEKQKANNLVKDAKKQMTSIVSSVYRNNGNSFSSIAPIVQIDGLENAYIIQIATSMFGKKADAKLQTVQALEDVAKVIESRERKALQDKKRFARQEKKQLDSTNESLANVENKIKSLDRQKSNLIRRLAEQKGRTVAAERQYQREQEAKRQREINEANRRAAEATRRVTAPPPPVPAVQARPAPSVQPQVQQVAPPPPPVYNPPPAEPAPVATGGLQQSAIAFARTKIGQPYIWGGNGPYGYDCSGLTRAAYLYAGVDISRTTWTQFKSPKVTLIPLSQKQPGDLLFWGNGADVWHVALYTGNEMMIEAPRPGASIHETRVWYQNISPYVGRVHY